LANEVIRVLEDGVSNDSDRTSDGKGGLINEVEALISACAAPDGNCRGARAITKSLMGVLRKWDMGGYGMHGPSLVDQLG